VLGRRCDGDEDEDEDEDEDGNGGNKRLTRAVLDRETHGATTRWTEIDWCAAKLGPVW